MELRLLPTVGRAIAENGNLLISIPGRFVINCRIEFSLKSENKSRYLSFLWLARSV